MTKNLSMSAFVMITSQRIVTRSVTDKKEQWKSTMISS